jgi:hypothetical protein
MKDIILRKESGEERPGRSLGNPIQLIKKIEEAA